MKSFFCFSIIFLGSCLVLPAQMVGYVHLKEAMIWVQAPGAKEVQIEYWEKDKPQSIKETAIYKVEKASAYTAHVICDDVEPGTTYEYQILFNETPQKYDFPLTFRIPPLWQYRSQPPELKIALGSCAYIGDKKYDRPGRSYGGSYKIFSEIAKKKPDVMVWLGDNVYLRETDWYSETGFHYRYSEMRKLQEIQPLLASTINLAIWDDHDYGPNDSDRSFIGKTISRKVFQEFWGNPTYGVENQGTASFYEWGDVQFFLTDNRWFRSPNEMKSAKRDCFGESQLNALIESLISSNSRRLSKFDNKDYLGKDCFKFVCVGGQILNDVPVYENLILIAPHERDTLLARIARENIKNVVFLSGDRHHSELSKKMLLSAKGDSIAVYDWTVSPLTSSVASGEKEPNTYQVPDSYFRQRCFGTMDITGNQNARTLRLALCDTLGKSFWNYEIQAAH